MSVGKVGDYYIDQVAGQLYGPKTSTGWPASPLLSLVGPMGPQGATGATGAAGPQGTPGTAGATGAKGDTGPQGIQGVQGLTGSTGAKGDTGATGSTGAIGPQGPTGTTGATGAAGTNGNTIITIATSPPTSAQGVTGDYAYNPNTQQLYGPRSAASPFWGTATVLKGTQGTSLVSGSGAPGSQIGNVGDSYIDSAAGVLYAAKTTNGWATSGLSLIGPAGATGPAGQTGATGAQGPQGTTGATGAQGPQGSPGAAGTSQIALGSQALGTCPTSALQAVTISATPTIAAVPGSTAPCFFVPSAPCALLGAQVYNIGVAASVELYDLTAAKSIWSSGSVAANTNTQFGQFGVSAYPMTQGNTHVWRVTGSGSSTVYIMPSYLLPSAQPTAAICQPVTAGRFTPTTFTTTAAPLYYPGGTTQWQGKWLRAGWVYGATATFIPSSGTSASSTYSYIFQNLTTATNLFGITVTANSAPTNFGPYGSNQFPIVAGNAYGWFVVNAGTGIAMVDTLVVQ